jgi:AmmeMemoRadiSam system protein A
MYLTREEKDSLLKLTRACLQSYVLHNREIETLPPDLKLTERLKEPAGAFVTLENEGQLRGCIGYIEPVRPLYQTVMENTVSACSKDYRFAPVRPTELDTIEIEISVLTPKEEIEKPEDFLPGRDGIIIEKEGRRAVFLPQVALEQHWDREQTLQHLCRKAGLPIDA